MNKKLKNLTRGCLGMVTASLALNLTAATAETWWKQSVDDVGRKAWQAPSAPEWILPKGTVAAISGGEKGITLERAEPLGANVEIEAVFQLNPDAGKTASVELRTAITATEPKSSIFVSVNYVQGQPQLNWRASDPTERSAFKAGTITLLNSSMRQLNWPENMRRIVEGEIASMDSLNTRWQSMRVQLRENSYRIYLNDRLLVDLAKVDLPTTGKVTFKLTAGSSLASLTSRPLPPENPIYWPVRIGDRVNARSIGKVAIKREALPVPNVQADIKGIPFVFPAMNERGQDHLDLGASWLQSGYLEGWFSSGFGVFGGRFIGTQVENPARLQFTIPTGRYKAIHLIAASDDDPDNVPLVTALFYKPRTGLPEHCEARVPLFSQDVSDVKPFKVALENGEIGNLYHVVIPIEPGKLNGLQDLSVMEVELTKGVQLYRSYPDPIAYSAHGAGLPSAVHVYAMTMERTPVDLELEPGNWGYVWTEPEQPSITARLQNRTAQEQKVELTFTAVSFDGNDRLKQTQTTKIGPEKSAEINFKLKPELYGYYSASLALKAGSTDWVEPLSLAYLRKDTRQRGDWERSKGHLFGCWLEQGGHHTPPVERELLVMGLAGMEGLFAQIETNNTEACVLAEKFGMKNIAKVNRISRIAGALWSNLHNGMPEDEAVAKFMDEARQREVKPGKFNNPMTVSFYAEPHIGASTYGTRADYLGDTTVNQMPPDLVERAKSFGRAFALGAQAIKKEWPGTLCLMPHGDIMFAVTVLEHSPEARKVFDGSVDDMHGGDRLPEEQIHQCALNRHVMYDQEMARMGITNCFMMTGEGPYIPSLPGSLTLAEHADLLLRSQLILMGYGAKASLGGWRPFSCDSSYGENYSHGDGLFERLPICTPRPGYATYATMTRHLNRKNFDGWLPTGSSSVYAMRFKHWQEDTHNLVIWTIRGKRAVTIRADGDKPVVVYDMMDNAIELQPQDGRVTFMVSSSPVFVDGAASDTTFALDEPDHSDADPSTAILTKLGNVGDGSWSMSTERDVDYENSMSDFIRRIPGSMTVRADEAPEKAGTTSLAIELSRQQSETNFYMPFYTTLIPAKPIVIPGKGSHLGLWVRASSDWGRLTYALRDAKGERWLSTGLKGSWNSYDMNGWVSFCFDGWRYLRFELPANAPWDLYRENGSTWWGYSGAGDGIVDLPLTLEKILVERRTHTIYVNDVQPADPAPVLLADLVVEYANEQDKTAEAVRLSKLRMPVPKGTPALDNPIVTMKETGIGQAPDITKITQPEQEVNGRQCHVHFPVVEKAQKYEIWASPYPDGRGAINLTGPKGWTTPGNLLRGFTPDTDFYLFLIIVDENGKRSKPSPAYKIQLKNMMTQSYV